METEAREGEDLCSGDDDEGSVCVRVWRLSVAVSVCVTCDKQRVHAWGRLGGLEHFGDVLFRQRGLSSALPLGVLLLTPLEVLKGETQRGRGSH